MFFTVVVVFNSTQLKSERREAEASINYNAMQQPEIKFSF